MRGSRDQCFHRRPNVEHGGHVCEPVGACNLGICIHRLGALGRVVIRVGRCVLLGRNQRCHLAFVVTIG